MGGIYVAAAGARECPVAGAVMWQAALRPSVPTGTSGGSTWEQISSANGQRV